MSTDLNKVSERAVIWISSYLNSTGITRLTTTKCGFPNSSQMELRSQGLRFLKALELKRIAHDICRTDQFLDLGHVSSGNDRETCLRYCEMAFQKLQSNPSLWVHLDNLLLRSNQVPVPNLARSSVSSVSVSAPNRVLQEKAVYSAPVVRIPMPVSKNLPTIVQRPATTSSSLSDEIEYVDGIICVNLVKYPDEIPKKLMDAMKRKSEYLGYPSKLRFEQVKIKREKQEKIKSKFAVQQDLPNTQIEVTTVSLLRQMGFQDIQEIMSSLRNIQRLSTHIMNTQELADAVMMDIVTNREENDEAKKMDAARVLSEATATAPVRAEHNDSESDVVIMYDSKEMLGIGIEKSVAYPESELLKSAQVKNVFYSVCKSSDRGHKLITKLLNLETKCSKWYGRKIPVAYFRFILKERIKVVRNANVVYKFLQDEISEMEKAMYDLSKQVDGVLGLKVPKLFMDVYQNAIKKGRIEDDSNKVIVID